MAMAKLWCCPEGQRKGAPIAHSLRPPFPKTPLRASCSQSNAVSINYPYTALTGTRMRLSMSANII